MHRLMDCQLWRDNEKNEGSTSWEEYIHTRREWKKKERIHTFLSSSCVSLSTEEEEGGGVSCVTLEKAAAASGSVISERKIR